MPTLSRFIVTLCIVAGLVYAGMFALATFVTPRQGEMVVPVPLERLNQP